MAQRRPARCCAAHGVQPSATTVCAISVDGGSGSMADLEERCRLRGITLFVLPRRSPKLHGAVERANRTHTEESY